MGLFDGLIGAGVQGIFGGLFGGGQKAAEKRQLKNAKQLAAYKEELDEKSGLYASRLRETEAQSNFGRTTQLNQQQYTLGETRAQSDFGRTTQLNQQTATLGEERAQADFGRNYKLGEQQITGQEDLEKIRQDATTGRLNFQLQSQQTMQQKGFDQQNLYRAQSAALAMRGLN